MQHGQVMLVVVVYRFLEKLFSSYYTLLISVICINLCCGFGDFCNLESILVLVFVISVIWDRFG